MTVRTIYIAKAGEGAKVCGHPHMMIIFLVSSIATSMMAYLLLLEYVARLFKLIILPQFIVHIWSIANQERIIMFEE